jgi:sterol desaturase/sphingolipid hydroxylase (fatty acid hydroxylase superfamily)
MDIVSSWFTWLGTGIAGNVLRVLAYPINPNERVFVLYLATSFLIAAGVYTYLTRHQSDGRSISLLQFLFPRSVWSSRSAWLDVRYFFFHQILRVFLYGSFVAMVSNWTFQVATGLRSGSMGSDLPMPPGTPASWPLDLGYAFIAITAFDLVAYLLHYCQHRVPVLWEFNKVHHSATVMHPLTNYREHPVDNVTYAVGLGACTGLVAAAAFALLGYVPSQPTLFGVGIFAFAYNSLGYNLRHSHIWLRWPGALVYFFGCPAHHQVHHSYEPAHRNKNFAFMFPVWDVIFGTFHVPQDNANVKFGLGPGQEDEFTSCIALYWLPVRSALSLLRRK